MEPPEFGDLIDPKKFPVSARKALVRRIRARIKPGKLDYPTLDQELSPYRTKYGVIRKGPPGDDLKTWANYDLKVTARGNVAETLPVLMEWLWDNDRKAATRLIDTYYRKDGQSEEESMLPSAAQPLAEDAESGSDLEAEISRRQPRAPDHNFLASNSFDPDLPPHPNLQDELTRYERLERKAVRHGYEEASCVVHQGQDFAWRCLLRTDEWINWLAGPILAGKLPDPFGPGTPLFLDESNKTSFIIDCEPGISLTFYYDSRYFRAELSRHVRRMSMFKLSMWSYRSPSLLTAALTRTIGRGAEEREQEINRRVVGRAVKLFSQLCDDVETVGRRIDTYSDPQYRWIRTPASGVLEIFPDKHGTRGPLWGQQMDMAELFAAVTDPSGSRPDIEIDTVSGTVLKVLKSHGDTVEAEDRIMLLDIS